MRDGPGWVRSVKSGIPYYSSSKLDPDSRIVHAFTTRLGGVSEGRFSTLNMGDHVDDNPSSVEENRRRVAKAFGYSLSNVITARQVHGNKVALVTGVGTPSTDVDALITNTTGILLMLIFADCVPIFLYDNINGAVGIVHSGWKGSALNIATAAVSAMHAVFGTDPGSMRAAIGPCIGRSKYEVSSDVAECFVNELATGPTDYDLAELQGQGTYLLNLKEVVKRQLVATGLPENSIDISEHCTFENGDDYFSHRRDSQGTYKTGRMAGIIGLTR